MWIPATALEVDGSNHPPGEGRERSPDSLVTSEGEERTSLKTFEVPFKTLFSPHAQCAGRHLSSSSSSQDEKPDSTRTPSVTSLARGVEGDPQWRYRIFDVVGAKLSLVHAEDSLRLTVWSANTQKGYSLPKGK